MKTLIWTEKVDYSLEVPDSLYEQFKDDPQAAYLEACNQIGNGTQLEEQREATYEPITPIKWDGRQE